MATTDIYQHIQAGLVEKRQSLRGFLETASEAEKDIRLCKDGTCIDEHLHVIDESLGKIVDGTLGACTVCHGIVDTSLLEMDYTACICLDHYSENERRRLESELELSQIVQRALMPHRAPVISGVEVAAFSRPAEIIGGDYFDFFKFKDGTHGLVIADVSGHGVSAGMLMSSLQTALQTMAPDTDSPAEILERINRFYIHNIRFTTFVTIFLARYDSNDRTLTYVNSGHNPPVVFRKNASEIHWLTRTAPAVGLSEHYFPRTKMVKFSEGDVLLLYTDGLTEAFNNEMEQFGQERLVEFIQSAADLSSSDMLQVIRRGISAYSMDVPLADDLTLVVLKVT
jgi:sigma-B regulation protein RsbU (phosphoserine phosphatase)